MGRVTQHSSLFKTNRKRQNLNFSGGMEEEKKEKKKERKKEGREQGIYSILFNLRELSLNSVNQIKQFRDLV